MEIWITKNKTHTKWKRTDKLNPYNIILALS